MKRSFWQRLDGLARQFSPVLLTLALVILNILPLPLPDFARVAPVLPLMAIYHWSVYAPELMPTPAVFGIGLLFDILSGAPLGANALMFLVAYGLVSAQRRFLIGKPFFIIWSGFAIVAAGAGVFSWALTSAYHFQLLDTEAFLVQGAITIGLFPVLDWLFLRWQHAFLREA